MKTNKIIYKNTPEQQELLLEIIKVNKKAINAFQTQCVPIYEYLIKDKKLNIWYCDWMPVEKLELTVKCEIPVILLNKKFK